MECWWTGKLWATSLLQVAVRGGSPARQEIAGEGKEGLTTTTDTREKKQDTGGIHNMGVLFELWSCVVTCEVSEVGYSCEVGHGPGVNSSYELACAWILCYPNSLSHL